MVSMLSEPVEEKEANDLASDSEAVNGGAPPSAHCAECRRFERGGGIFCLLYGCGSGVVREW